MKCLLSALKGLFNQNGVLGRILSGLVVLSPRTACSTEPQTRSPEDTRKRGLVAQRCPLPFCCSGFLYKVTNLKRKKGIIIWLLGHQGGQVSGSVCVRGSAIAAPGASSTTTSRTALAIRGIRLRGRGLGGLGFICVEFTV